MRDLAGETVILTRAVADNAPLETLLRSRGAHVIDLPCVAVRPLANLIPLRRALRSLGRNDRVVVTSRTGVEAMARALEGVRLVAPLAVVGQATRDAANRAGLPVDFMPSRPDGATLGHELPLPRGIVLLARSDRAGTDLPQILRRRGAEVREILAYRTETPTVTDLAVARATLAGERAIVCFASASAVDGFIDLVGQELAWLVRPVAFGPKTAGHIRRRLSREPSVAGSPDLQTVARAIGRAALEVAGDAPR